MPALLKIVYKNMIAIRGIHSNIAFQLRHYCNLRDEVIEVKRNDLPPLDADRYLFCQGLLYGKRRVDMTEDEISETYKVNYASVACTCEAILTYNPVARICVIGSESGIVGSYDECYADAKRLLHHYVETKKIEPGQQFVCVAPGIIEDAGMTIRREDRENLFRIRENHPKGRFLRSIEVARMVYFLLYVDIGYTTNVVIRMNGGSHLP